MNKSEDTKAESSHLDDSAFIKQKFSESIGKMKEKSFSLNDESDLLVAEEIADTWVDVSDKNLRVYSLITSEVLKGEYFDEEDEDINVLITNIIHIDEIGKIKTEDLKSWSNFIAKILDHIELAQHQQNIFSKLLDRAVSQNELLENSTEQLLQQIEVLKADSKILEEELSSMNKENRKVKKQNKSLIKKQEKIQKDFISILGIFAAILLASFGGLTIISNILKDFNAPLGKVLILSSLSILSVLILIFLLLNGISKLTGENLRNCKCGIGQDCTCTLVSKHPTLYVSSVVLIIVFVLGVFELLIDFEVIKSYFNNVILIGLLFVSLFIILLSSAVYKSFDK
ncbi:hypothetical protein [Solibacillus sp. CAU 1738]|uniref:hypothetical protein n=1 Tax=Solibacillus sp. CAU 1738 TaxID=3140363 RepID=UPI0032615FB8